VRDQETCGCGNLTVSLVFRRVIIECKGSQIDVPYKTTLVWQPPYGDVHTLNITNGIRYCDLLSCVLSAGNTTGDPEVRAKIE
jgi:hypothetical protein